VQIRKFWPVDVTQRYLSGLTFATQIFDRAFRAAHPNTMKHYELVANDPTYLELAGDIIYVEEEPVPQAAVALKEGRLHKWLRTEA